MTASIKPIKRSPQLAPLSREHHEGLLFVWKIRQGFKKEVPVTEIYSYIQWFWKNELEAHLLKEEEVLINDLPEEDTMMHRMLKEHAEIREKMAIPLEGIDVDFLSELASQLEKHIRFEERELFPYIERTLQPELLDDLGKQLANKKACITTWTNEFWLRKN